MCVSTWVGAPHDPWHPHCHVQAAHPFTCTATGPTDLPACWHIPQHDNGPVPLVNGRGASIILSSPHPPIPKENMTWPLQL